MRTFKFVKDIGSRWYIDLPEWDGDRSDLEMVMGADTMLDIIAQGSQEVHVSISTEPFRQADTVLTHKEDYLGGAWYYLSSTFHQFDVWLCKVTKFIYGEMPKKIYLKKS